MRQARLLVRVLGLLLVVGLSACAPAGPVSTPQPTPDAPSPTAAPSPSPTSAPDPFFLTILHTNDVAGEIDPCG